MLERDELLRSCAGQIASDQFHSYSGARKGCNATDDEQELRICTKDGLNSSGSVFTVISTPSADTALICFQK